MLLALQCVHPDSTPHVLMLSEWPAALRAHRASQYLRSMRYMHDYTCTNTARTIQSTRISAEYSD
jgi:hypothetical protein